MDESLPGHMTIILDGDCVTPSQRYDTGNDGDDAVGSVHNLKTHYTKLEDYLEKAASLLDDPTDLLCRICQGRLTPSEELVVVCPQAGCHCISHMACLSARFLNDAGDPDRLVPMHGVCPACEKTVHWPVIMQELTLRRRGDKEVRAILRRKKRNEDKLKKTENASDVPKTVIHKREASHLDGQDSSDDPPNDEPLDENWVEELASESDSDTDALFKTRSEPRPSRLEIVIEDSEDE